MENTENSKKKLSIRSKVLYINLFCIFVFSIFLYLFSSSFLLNGFIHLEKDYVVDNIYRVKSSLKEIGKNQDIKVTDWSFWDDTYQFIEDKNKEYIESNLTNESLASLQTNAIIFINNKDEIVYSKFVDIDSGDDLPQENLLSFVKSNINEIKNISGRDNINNTIKLPEGDMVISVNQILKSNQSGESRGMVMFGSFISEETSKKISGLVNFPVGLYRYDISADSDDIILAKNNLSKNKDNFVHVVSKDTVHGYTLIHDIYDNPIEVIKIELPRDIYEQGVSMVYTSVFVIAFLVLILGIIILVFLEKFIIKRLVKVSNEVEKINESGDFSKTIDDDADDEIGNLSSLMNKMFKKVKDFEEKEEKMDEADKAMNEKMKKHIDELDKLNKLMVGRELKMIELKKENAKLKEEKTNLV